MKKNTSKSMRNNTINSSSGNAANSRTDRFYGMRKKAGKEIMNQGSTRMLADNPRLAYEKGAKGDAYGRGVSLKDMPSVGGSAKKQKNKMKSGGSFIEPSKELKFGGTQKYSGGGYPTYAKGSEQSKSFQEAFGKARRSGKSTFEWEGRKYGTRLSGESDADYKARIARSGAGTSETSKGKSASAVPTAPRAERGLVTGSRPTLSSAPATKPKSAKKENSSNERKTDRVNRRAERQAKPNRKQREVMKSSGNAKTVTKDKTSAATRNAGSAGTGMKISANTNPTSYARRSSGMNMSQVGGKEVNMSAMQNSGRVAARPSSAKSKPAGKSIGKPATGRAARINERANRVTERAANRNDRQNAKSSRREGVKSAKANLRAARRG